MPQPEFGDEPVDTCEKRQGEFGVSELRFSQRCETCSVLTADHEAEVERLRAALREVARNACVWDRDAITAAIGEPT